MDVFLMVRRKKTTIFVDAKETTTVMELKKILCGITKELPENQRLTDENGTEIFSDEKTLSDYNLTSQMARAQSPASIGLCLRNENGDFESLEMSPLSTPPELPEVMKSIENQAHDNN